jgi:hypothetical protein
MHNRLIFLSTLGRFGLENVNCFATYNTYHLFEYRSSL